MFKGTVFVISSGMPDLPRYRSKFVRVNSMNIVLFFFLFKIGPFQNAWVFYNKRDNRIYVSGKSKTFKDKICQKGVKDIESLTQTQIF